MRFSTAAMKPVGCGVVGMGMGRNRARQIAKEAAAGEPVQLVAVCDLVQERAQQAASELGVPWTTDYTQWFENPEVEVVYVVNETGNHAKVAVEALRAGKHVLCTKPMEATLTAAQEMVKAAAVSGLQLAIDFDKRHTSATAQRIQAALAHGLFGRLLVGDSSLRTLRQPVYFAENGGWRGTWALDGGGAMSNQAVHEIDQLYAILGMPDSVEARIWTQNHAIEAEDLGLGVWHYNDARVGFVRATTCWPAGGWYSRHEIHGTEGAVIWSDAPQASEQWFIGGKWLAAPPDFHLDLRTATQRFALAVRLGEPMPVDGNEGLRSLAVLKAMYASVTMGKPVSPIELIKSLSS